MEVERLEVWAFSDINGWDESIAEHDEILQAIEGKDYERGLAVLEKNRLTTYNDFVERLVERASEETTVIQERAWTNDGLDPG